MRKIFIILNGNRLAAAAKEFHRNWMTLTFFGFFLSVYGTARNATTILIRWNVPRIKILLLPWIVAFALFFFAFQIQWRISMQNRCDCLTLRSNSKIDVEERTLLFIIIIDQLISCFLSCRCSGTCQWKMTSSQNITNDFTRNSNRNIKWMASIPYFPIYCK